jgi:hypothetical protein
LAIRSIARRDEMFGCWSYVDIEVDSTGTIVSAIPGVHWNPGMASGIGSNRYKELEAEAEAEAKALLGTRPLMGDGNPLYSPAGKYRI